MSQMRAKMTLQLVSVSKRLATETEPEQTTSETLAFSAVCTSPFDKDGNSEDNTYAKWTPSASVNMTITNPALFGKFKQGDTFYVDFTRVEAPAPDLADGQTHAVQAPAVTAEPENN